MKLIKDLLDILKNLIILAWLVLVRQALLALRWLLLAFFPKRKSGRRKFSPRPVIAFFFSLCLIFAMYFTWVFLSLPRLLDLEDYQPPLLTEVYDRSQNKIGEFFLERRQLIAYEDMPKHLIEAFVAAEDGSFFSHRGLNYKAIFRAFLANLKAGKKIQGGSTITQQLARSLLLSSKKTYTRKFKEAVLALRMEASLSKQDILYIYLNQIYFGHGAYGIEMASRMYFQKPAKNLSLPEAALLAGLPKAPSRFSPVFYPKRAKSRQIYVLRRMRDEGLLSEKPLREALAAPLKIHFRRDFNSQSPYFLETVRQVLLQHFSQEEILTSGLQIHTALDLARQKAAQEALKKGLEDLDKRRGWRGAARRLPDPEERSLFLSESAKRLQKQLRDHIVIPGSLSLPAAPSSESDFHPGGDFQKKTAGKAGSDQKDPLPAEIPAPETFKWESHAARLKGKIFQAAVSRISSKGIEIAAPWGRELLPLESFQWAVPAAEKPDKKTISHPKEAFQLYDFISLKVEDSEKKGEPSKKPQAFLQRAGLSLSLYQEPLAEGALLSFDLESGEIAALVGGYDYGRSQFNRAYQSRRQSGSSFKPFIYGAALERGFHPASVISDSPLVFSGDQAEENPASGRAAAAKEEPEKEVEDWRPANISERFSGELLFRSALIRSLNIPTVNIIKEITIPWARFYVRRLGIFSPLNRDYTMALGSSSLTLYETLKAFSVFPRQGRGLSGALIRRVEDRSGRELLPEASLDELFADKIQAAAEFVREEAEKRLSKPALSERESLWAEALKGGSPHLIPPSNSYVMTNLLQSVIADPEGTGGRARALKRPLAGKTGTTDDYHDAWFLGFSPFFSAGVWVGFDEGKTLGRGETGSRAALPIWMDYMKEAHKDLPEEGFAIPEGVVFANIDSETGSLVSSKTAKVAEQAFFEGTEPQAGGGGAEGDGRIRGISLESEAAFIKEDLSQ